ncbi:hypothetical protein A6A04_01870 [Paramagnetospirillum marisnigri]|uniref:DUF2846 domain-containing protein n=1 Tax=Paramagnetospirillum marisnigri TaxID=1285242 RepID=A0A178MN35_9PROT|nr:hypothetical protein [Paramagnetospirillum marisnigri]OAN50182.1 hypothetical protein A6A04_01870 [Paramagnetospirillum marisnigri]
MRRLLALALLLLVSACYQVDGDVVPLSSSVRVEGVRDGLYRRPDGVEVRVHWNEADKVYDVVAPGSEQGRGGTARAQRVASGLYLVQYMDVTRLALLARMDGSDMVLMAPNKDAEPRLLKAHGLGLKPGPINGLLGSGGMARNFFKDLAASGDFAEGGRMTFVK